MQLTTGQHTSSCSVRIGAASLFKTRHSAIVTITLEPSLDQEASMLRRTWLLTCVVVWSPVASYGQAVTLGDAIRLAEANNRTIQIAELDRRKAQDDRSSVRTHRWPIFSITALGSQPLSQVGVTLERGSLGVYPTDGPIPGQTTTLQGPLTFGFIGYASIAQPLTQQYKIGLGIDLAGVAVEATSEQLRAKRHAIVNEVRHLYYGIAQAESGRSALRATVEFLKQLERETSQQVVERVALRSDELGVKAQLVQAEYELLKMDDPIASQKEQLNRLMGRPIDTAFDIVASTISAI